VTPFLRRNSRFHLPAPVFSGRQLLWSGREVKRLRDNSGYRFHPDPAEQGNMSALRLSWHDISRPRLSERFPGRQPGRILTFRLGCHGFSALAAFSFPASVIAVRQSGARALRRNPDNQITG
jgi:hypothetical protein